MSKIGSWALSMLSPSQANLHQDTNNKRSVSVQTLLSASGTHNISNEWLFKDEINIDSKNDDVNESLKNPPNKRRKRIPDKPHKPLGLWSVLKDLIGQNLTNVALPVNINEPLTILQRMTESFEYSYLLDRAADCKNVYDQISYLAAFSISGYSPSEKRTGKPFNPLLGETYEFDRSNDLGWKCIVEQVSHRPAISALHCESDKWICWENVAGNMYFRGKYIRVVPSDYRYVKFKTNQKTYRLGTAETMVHNILFGNVWIDHCGKADIVSMDDTIKCSLSFIPYSSFSRGPQRKVNGEVSAGSKVKRLISGFWNDKVEIAFNLADDDGEMTANTASFETVWERRPPAPESTKYYNFSEFACELNELEDGVAPTDSRLRPDLRLMEEAKWDESNEMKLKLEEKQRQANHQREAENAELLIAGSPNTLYNPTWFVKTRMTGEEDFIHIYNGEYWRAKGKGDWSACPNIFL